jgi:hypothetical protein
LRRRLCRRRSGCRFEPRGHGAKVLPLGLAPIRRRHVDLLHRGGRGLRLRLRLRLQLLLGAAWRLRPRRHGRKVLPLGTATSSSSSPSWGSPDGRRRRRPWKTCGRCWRSRRRLRLGLLLHPLLHELQRLSPLSRRPVVAGTAERARAASSSSPAIWAPRIVGGRLLLLGRLAHGKVCGSFDGCPSSTRYFRPCRHAAAGSRAQAKDRGQATGCFKRRFYSKAKVTFDLC